MLFVVIIWGVYLVLFVLHFVYVDGSFNIVAVWEGWLACLYLFARSVSVPVVSLCERET